MSNVVDVAPPEVPSASAEPSAEPTRKRRISGLDLARAIALLGMLFAHFGGSAVGGNGGWGSHITAFTNGRAMPLFVILSERLAPP
jgi:peptidoglycan/LPS O-acetylase OafA/YrhL